MAPLLLPHLLPALLLLAVADALPPSCSNVTCGDHVVQYPFSLHESDCGYPGLDLICEKNTTLILPVKSHRYRVAHIDYQAHTVAVSDADVDGAEYSTICPVPTAPHEPHHRLHKLLAAARWFRLQHHIPLQLQQERIFNRCRRVDRMSRRRWQ
jgi:hypothetical protein